MTYLLLLCLVAFVCAWIATRFISGVKLTGNEKDALLEKLYDLAEEVKDPIRYHAVVQTIHETKDCDELLRLESRIRQILMLESRSKRMGQRKFA